MWAVLMGVVVTIAAAASAAGSTGGAGGSGSTQAEGAHTCRSVPLWGRRLQRGHCGRDVRTLSWVLKSRQVGESLRLSKRYRKQTRRGVANFQRRTRGVRASGVVNKATHRALLRAMDSRIATWYGPGFWGNRTACGQTLRRGTVGVAHKRLPCGSKVVIRHKGRYLRTTVIDRGPYAHGATWDLTQAAAERLRMTETSRVRSAAIWKR